MHFGAIVPENSKTDQEKIVLGNLMLVTLVVIVFWVVIIGLFLSLTRKQPEIQARLTNLEEQLDQSEQGGS
ncbi:MAG: hypothetical protein KJ046_03750 [Anaerolineae bacterium]|nr:hypothetical protein [Anaerolineae bacterium]RIK24240.1 MAG: hypothetical protein DCC51_00760 [Anaerolineae bacterium]